MNKNYDIFISFKDRDNNGNPTKDSETVEELAEYLVSKGLKVFYTKDRVDILGADTLSDEAEQALNSSKVFIVLSSREEFFISKWLQLERKVFLKLKAEDDTKVICSYIIAPMQSEDLPEYLKPFPSFVESEEGVIDNLYDFIFEYSNHSIDSKDTAQSGEQKYMRYKYMVVPSMVAFSLLATIASFIYLANHDTNKDSMIYDREYKIKKRQEEKRQEAKKKKLEKKKQQAKKKKVEKKREAKKKQKKRKKTAVDYLKEGNRYRGSGNCTYAIRLYKKALDLNPNFSRALFHMGTCYRLKKDYYKAIMYFTKVTVLHPNKAKAYYYIGFSYEALEEYEKATEAYKRAAELNSSEYQVYYDKYARKLRKMRQIKN